MRPQEHEKMYELEDTYWWFVGRRDILRTILRPLARGGKLRILDVGCGTGANLVLLSQYGAVTGADAYPAALEFCRRRGFSDLRLCPVEQLDFPDESFDLVTAIELLEHLEDDVRGLRECFRVLRPGGRMLITVPAYQFLWSEHDEALDHYRRYSRRQLAQRLRQAGFAIERMTFCITFLLPLIVAFRLAQRAVRAVAPKRGESKTALIQLPAPINRFFVWLLRIEAVLLRAINLPCGVTLVCVARKPAGAGEENGHSAGA